MPNYRRFYLPGGTFFLTLVTHERSPLFAAPDGVARLRGAVAQVKSERSFDIPAAVVLPDHIHFLWSLPTGDSDYSRRVGRLKALFTRSLRGPGVTSAENASSRGRHREGNVWQRRFWEHTILDENDFERHLNYIHYNPVKHGLASCPHDWPYSSFGHWVRRGDYPQDWGCCCSGRTVKPPRMATLDAGAGE